MRNEMLVMEEMVEEVNDSCYGVAEAYEEDGYLFVKSLRLSPTNADLEKLEDHLYPIIEGLRMDFNVDFDVEYMKGRTMVLNVLF